MPCDTRREVTVELKATDPEVLIAGLFADGFNVNTIDGGLYVNKGARRAEIDLNNGRVTVREGDQAIINQIKRAYSGEIVRNSASRFGWNLTATNQPNVMLAKRRF